MLTVDQLLKFKLVEEISKAVEVFLYPKQLRFFYALRDFGSKKIAVLDGF